MMNDKKTQDELWSELNEKIKDFITIIRPNKLDVMSMRSDNFSNNALYACKMRKRLPEPTIVSFLLAARNVQRKCDDIMLIADAIVDHEEVLKGRERRLEKARTRERLRRLKRKARSQEGQQDDG